MPDLVGSALRSTRLRNAFYRASSVPGLRAAQRRLARLVIPQGALRWVIVPQGINEGYEMLVDPRAELGYLRGDHEPWIQGLLRAWLSPGETFFDIGSHAGFFALAATRLVGSGGRVVALEPDPVNFARLRAIADRNQVTNLAMIEAAAWRENGHATFGSSAEVDRGVRGAVLDDPESSNGLSVATVTIDGLADRWDPNVVKVDVEGGEVDSLAGAGALLARRTAKWVIEVHGPELEASVLRTLTDAGYAVEASSPEHESYADYQQKYLIAIPR